MTQQEKALHSRLNAAPCQACYGLLKNLENNDGFLEIFKLVMPFDEVRALSEVPLNPYTMQTAPLLMSPALMPRLLNHLFERMIGCWDESNQIDIPWAFRLVLVILIVREFLPEDSVLRFIR